MLLEIQYSLNRRQRLIPHLKIRGIHQLLILGCLVGVAAVVRDEVLVIVAVLGLIFVWIIRKYLEGIMNALCLEWQKMEVKIDASGLYCLDGVRRFHMPIDLLIGVRDLEPSVWTIQDRNGNLLNIPKIELTDDVLVLICDAACRYNPYR